MKVARIIRALWLTILSILALALSLLAAPTGAQASSVNWYAIAQCESSGNWSINTGNGFYGGLQFAESTWLVYGGGAYASFANLATPSQQIAIAERVLAGQGIGAWPVCGRYAGSTATFAAPRVTPNVASRAAPSSVAPKTAPRDTEPDGDADDAVTGQHYTVVPGNTLWGIALAHHVAGGWPTVYAHSRGVVGPNPNLIFPGQVLVL